MKVRLSYHYVYRAGTCGSEHFLNFQYNAEFPCHGNITAAFREYADLIRDLCNLRENNSSKAAYTRFRVRTDFYELKRDDNGKSPDYVVTNAYNLVKMIVNYVNIYLPEKIIYSVVYRMFKTYACCYYMYEQINNELARRRRKAKREHGSEETIVSNHNRWMYAEQVEPLRSYIVYMSFFGDGAIDKEFIQMVRMKLDDVVATSCWETPHDVDPYYIFYNQRLNMAGKRILFCGVSPYLIDAFRVKGSHKLCTVIEDHLGGSPNLHNYEEMHTIFCNTYAAYLMTVASVNRAEYVTEEGFYRDATYLPKIWEAIEEMAKLPANDDGINMSIRMMDELWKSGMAPIIQHLDYT